MNPVNFTTTSRIRFLEKPREACEPKLALFLRSRQERRLPGASPACHREAKEVEMSDKSAPPPSIMMLITGLMPARLVFLAAEFGIADLIANGTTTAEGLAQRAGMHAPSRKRMLRALCLRRLRGNDSWRVFPQPHGCSVAQRCSRAFAQLRTFLP
jgi:hypothetical protein